MARRSFEVNLGPPYEGLNTYADPKALARKFVTAASWAEFSKGVVQGYFAPRTTAETSTGTPAAAATRFLHYAHGHGWLSDTVLLANGVSNWACRDAPLGANPVSYVTQVQANGTVNNPLVWFGPSSYRLGMPVPAAPALTNGGSLGRRYYSLTQLDVYGNESNPVYVGTAATAGGATFTTPAATAGTTAAKFNVYGSNLDDPAGSDGVRYFLQQVNPATLFTDTGAAGTATLPLDWGPGGTPSSDVLPGDHSVAPALSCISDGIHAALVSDEQATGLGIAFGADGSTVRWSMLGRTFYWPTFNAAILPYPVLAMVTRGAVTYAFTEGGVWSFSGITDSAIQVQRTTAPGVVRLGGKSVHQTPEGIMYVSRVGPMLFDGGTARPLTDGTLDQNTWNAAAVTYLCGAHYDGWSYLQVGGGACYALDMRRFPDISITAVSPNTGAFTVTPYISGGVTPSLYTCNNTSGEVYAWRPMGGTGVGTQAQQPWTITTARSDLDAPGRNKRARKVRAVVTGDVTMALTGYAASGATNAYALTLTSAKRIYLLPPAFDGVHFEATFTAAAGATQLVDVSLMGEVWDAA